MKKIYDIKRRVRVYKSLYSPLRLVNILPKFSYSKNVQAWLFTRNYTIYWFRWAVTYSIVIISDLSMNRSEAHKMNVKKYL